VPPLRADPHYHLFHHQICLRSSRCGLSKYYRSPHFGAKTSQLASSGTVQAQQGRSSINHDTIRPLYSFPCSEGLYSLLFAKWRPYRRTHLQRTAFVTTSFTRDLEILQKVIGSYLSAMISQTLFLFKCPQNSCRI